MNVKKLATVVSSMLLCWNVALPIPVALASEVGSTVSQSVGENIENMPYFSLTYDGSDQQVILSEELSLHLIQWKDENQTAIVAKIMKTDAVGQASEINIEIPTNNERTSYVISEAQTIFIAAQNGEAFKWMERAEVSGLTEMFLPVEQNDDNVRKERLALIDVFGTIIQWKEVFQYVDVDGSVLTEEEYMAKQSTTPVVEAPAEEVTAAEDPVTETVTPQIRTFATFSTLTAVTQMPSVNYSANVESIGWMTAVKDGETSGTFGQGKRVEALKIGVSGIKDLGITYSAHVQSVGWTTPVSNNQVIGTAGSGKRIEAIKVNLTGKQASNYDVYYRVHAQTYGWLGWAKNGESAGTEGLSRRIEAFEIKLVKKGAAAPGSTTNKLVQTPLAEYTSYIPEVGWQKYVQNGTTSGTEGLQKRIEAIRIKMASESGLDIRYTTHLQSNGWTNWSSAGDTSGIPDGNKRIEALKLELTGVNAAYFDIYYRVHAEKFGWLGWAKNGEPAGTQGYSYRAESYQIKIVPKGTYVSTGGEAFKIKDQSTISYTTHIQKIGWLDESKNGTISGTQNMALRMEAIKLSLLNDRYSGSISYTTHVQKYGWLDPVSDGALSGTTGEAKRLEAIKINLEGEIAQHYDIYYRTYVQSYGWLGWTKDGMPAGTEGLGKRLESIQIKLIEKGLPSPAVSEEDAFRRPAKKKVVFLDIGHGGSDPGAQYYGVNEKDLNLQIGFKVQHDLERAGYAVIMSRTTDTYLDYRTERSKIANESGADIFISLHNNAMPGNSYVNGIETFFYEYDPDYPSAINKDMHNDPDRLIRSAALANAIHNNLISYSGAFDRGVQSNAFAVLRETVLPAALIEFGFMSNYTELGKLKSDSYQSTLSKAVLDGVKSYFTTY